MQNVLLPLLQKLRLLPKKESQQNQQSDDSQVDSSLNLLPEKYFVKGVNTESVYGAIFLYKTVILLVCLVFLVVFVVNTYLNQKINDANKEIKLAYGQIIELNADQVYIEKEKALVLQYDSLNKQKESMIEKYTFVSKSIPDNIYLDSLSVVESTFDLSVHSPSTSLFADLLINLLSKDKLSSVSIISASINVDTHDIYVSLKGNFK